MPGCLPSSVFTGGDYTYCQYELSSISNVEELIKKGDFFKDKTTTEFSLSRASKDERFNIEMIEHAYRHTNNNDTYLRNPYIELNDKANILAIKAMNILQKKIDQGSEVSAKAGVMLNQLIIGKFDDRTINDIDIDNWVNRNRLAKALKLCIKDNYKQPDINKVIAERVIQYYQHINQGNVFLGCDPETFTDSMLFTIFDSQTQIVSHADAKGFFSELTASGDKRTIKKRQCMVFPDYG